MLQRFLVASGAGRSTRNRSHAPNPSQRSLLNCPNGKNMGTGLHVERCASDVRRVHSHADWVRADALTHRKPLSRRLLGARAERVTAVRAWSGATSARALLGSPDDGAVCRGHCLSNYSVQGQAVLDYWVVSLG